MNEQTTYSREAEQRRTFSPLTVVGQQVRLTLGRLISPPTEVAHAAPRCGVADVQRLECAVAEPAPRAA